MATDIQVCLLRRAKAQQVLLGHSPMQRPPPPLGQNHPLAKTNKKGKGLSLPQFPHTSELVLAAKALEAY